MSRIDEVVAYAREALSAAADPEKAAGAVRDYYFFVYQLSEVVKAEVLAPYGVTDESLRPMKEAISLIDRAVAELEEDGEGWYELGTVGTRLSNMSSEFDTRTYGHPKLSALVEATGRYDLDRSGPHLRIRPKS